MSQAGAEEKNLNWTYKCWEFSQCFKLRCILLTISLHPSSSVVGLLAL